MPMTSQFETANGVLLVTGSLDRGSDSEFTTALEKYCSSTAADQRVVDMTHVRWLAPTGAKVLIQYAQETQEKNGKMRVLASRHVFQTLNLLGAKTWMNIEVMTQGTTRHSSIFQTTQEPKADVAPPGAPAAEATAPAAAVAPVKEKDDSVGLGGGLGDMSLDPSLLESSGSLHAVHDFIPPPLPAAAPKTVPAPKLSGHSSSAMPAVRGPAPVVHAAAPVAVTGALAYPLEDLSGAAHLLRNLVAGKRYIFHFGMGEGFSAIVKERVGGPWIVVEVDGIRKWVNLELVATCEQL